MRDEALGRFVPGIRKTPLRKGIQRTLELYRRNWLSCLSRRHLSAVEVAPRADGCDRNIRIGRLRSHPILSGMSALAIMEPQFSQVTILHTNQQYREFGEVPG